MLHLPPLLTPPRGAVRARRSAAALLAVVVALALAATASCSSPSSTETSGTVSSVVVREEAGPPTRGGLLSVGIGAEPNNWSPYGGQWAPNVFIVARAIFDPLAVLDEHGEPRLVLAASVEPDATYTEWTVKLRPGISFHDGAPLDATALARNFQERKESALVGPTFVNTKAFTVVDPLTVRVTTNEPWATFRAALTGQASYLASPSMIEAARAGGSVKPVGTGPFRYDTAQSGQNIRVKRNMDYWQTDADGARLPYLDAVEFRINGDSASRRSGLAAGDLDVIEAGIAKDIAELQGEAAAGNYQIVSQDQHVNTTIIALNTAAPPFDDLTARQAVATAIDTALIADTLSGGMFRPATGVAAPASTGALAPSDNEYPAYDLERARQLAETYRDRTGKPLAFDLNVTSDPAVSQLGQQLQAQLREAGIEVRLNSVEQVTLVSSIFLGDYQSSLFTMSSTPTMDASFVFVATPPGPLGNISLNYTRYDNREATAALNAARQTPDPAARTRHYQEAQRAMNRSLDRLPLLHNASAMAFTNDVHGITTAVVPGGERIVIYEPTQPFLAGTWINS